MCVRFFASCAKRIIKFEFFGNSFGNSFEQCISYRNRCVYLECSTLRRYSAHLGGNLPAATNFFVQGPMLLDLE